MSRKDYELIAQSFKDELENIRELHSQTGLIEGSLFSLANRLAQQLKYDNEAFDYPRFIAACGF